MMFKNKVTLILDYDNGQSETVCFNLPDYRREENPFENPIFDLTGKQSIANVSFQETPPSLRSYILKHRDAVANRISEEITKFLLDKMAAKDTVNGYTKED